jgi:hypothetical protein
MMRVFLVIAALVFSFPAGAAEGGFTVDELVEACSKCSEDLKTGKRSYECAFCDGILTGTVSTLNLLEGNKSFCPPANLDTHRARNMFRLWAKSHPDDANAPAVWGALEAMKVSYGCQ